MTTQEFKKITSKKIKSKGARMVDFNLITKTVANVIAIRNHRVYRYTADIDEYTDKGEIIEIYYWGEMKLI